MPFQREAMHANGSGKSNLDNGGNLWVYSPTNGDSLVTIRGTNFFLPFVDALEVNDIILVVIGSATLSHEAVSVSIDTSVVITPLADSATLFKSVDTINDTPGAISLVTGVTEIITGAGALALTLAAGTLGQQKAITMITDGGGTATVTVTGGNVATIVFDAKNDSVLLIFGSLGWAPQAFGGVTFT